MPFNHIASLKASAVAVYSASVVDKATTLCTEAFQLIVQLFRVNKKLVRDLLTTYDISGLVNTIAYIRQSTELVYRTFDISDYSKSVLGHC